MTKCLSSSQASTIVAKDSFCWDNLYRLLRQTVKGWVYTAHLPAWYRQENDIIDEIVQEAVKRTFERLYKAEKHEATPVASITAFAKRTAHNYFIDLLRKDGRYMLLSQLTYPSGEERVEPELPDIADSVDDEVFCQSLFEQLAPEILNFPKKQRQVLLADLANHTRFSVSITPLQRALLKSGIHLEDYQKSRPEERVERSRFTALLSLAYRRVSTLESIKGYTA
jgi:DNA-directed RNA polymerase specialized sigma24 family protein